MVFPEYFISGIIADVDPDAMHSHYTQLPHAQHAEHRVDADAATEAATSDHWLESFRQLAVECGIDICPGTIVERHDAANPSSRTSSSTRPDLKNVAHYITKDGEIVGRYEKRNLW